MKFSKELFKGVTPYLVMHTLHELDEAYGYQVMKAIRTQSDDLFDFPDSTLYPILYRLEEQGLVRSETKTTPSNKERRYYQLTKDGKDWLLVHQKELSSYLKGLSRFLPHQAA
jgi:PadR family transcriptional regulator, regulatory protein PadR